MGKGVWRGVIRKIFFIAPGEITHVHTYKCPLFLCLISWLDCIRYENNGNIVFDYRSLSAPPSPSTALWSEPLMPHALKNVGDKDIHIICAEIKT
jgi:hypothetical protein